MATYRISAPDGNTYQIDGPEGATQEQVQSEVLRQHPDAGTAMAPKAPTGGGKTQAGDAVGQVLGESLGTNNPIAGGIEAAISGITGGLGSLADAATGAAPGTHNFAYVPRTQSGQDIAGGIGKVTHAVGQGADTALQAVGASDALRQTLAERVPEALGAVGTLVPALRAGGGVLDAASQAAAARAAAAPAAVTKFGMRTAENSPISRNLAGASARPTLTAHNQSIADPVLGAQAGIAQGTKLTPGKTFEDARQGPNSVYQRAGASLPDAPLSPAATQMLQGSGAEDMIVHSPDTVSQIEAQKQRLLSGPLSGSQVVDAQKTLRFNGFGNVGAEDPERTALGRFQLKAADALQQHMTDNLPPDAPVSADQLAQARVALAQNHTVENALGPNGNVDLQKLAKLHRDNPGMLSGPMADIAQFASDHPEVTSLPSKEERFNPSGLMKDISSIDLKKPVSYLQPFVGGISRQLLTGGAPEVPRVPVTGLGGEFGPIDRTPQPPPGMTASTPTAPPPAGGAPPGSIPLADLLSHGVEQGPSPRLSLAPEGGPAPQDGVPFQQNAEHMAGGLQVSPEDWLNKFLSGENNSDHAGVMSQGVPENIMTRAANNASGESAASQEAINRGTRALVTVDQDGNEAPVMRDVTQADRRAPTGKIIIDKSNGEIVDRGGMSQDRAQGLRNRWATVGRQLGDHFVMGRAGG